MTCQTWNLDKGIKRFEHFRFAKGASIKYVRAEGEGGCHRNDQFLRTIGLIGCVKSVREGGRGSKIPKILRTYLMDAPLRNFWTL